MSREIQEKTEAKKPEKRPRNGDRTAAEKGPKAPWSPATMGAWSPATIGIRAAKVHPETHFFGCGLVSEVFLKLTMAASLTITFDENKYQVMLQEKQSKRIFKRPASCRSITSLGNSQNTGSTSTSWSIVFGEKPTLYRTTKPTQHEPACSYKPKIKSCITRPRQEPARACSPATRPFISTGAELARSKASLRQAKDHVQILSIPVFKQDKLGCCARGTMSFIARAQPELTESQIARHIHRRMAYRQKRLEKQRTQHSELQISQKGVEKERPDQVATVHMVGKTKRRQKSATKIHVRRPVTRRVSRTRRHQEDSPTPSRLGHRITNFEQPPPDDDIASDTDEWEEFLETGEYLSDEEWIPESHLMPVIWYNSFQPQGSWSDDNEDQEVVQESAVNLAQTNALVDPNQVEPQGADEEEDLAPMPDLEEYAGILQRFAIEQEQDRINQLHQNLEPKVLENLQASPPVTPENEESCWIDDPLTSEDESDSQQSIVEASSIKVACIVIVQDDSASEASSAEATDSQNASDSISSGATYSRVTSTETVT
ncbi:hypothetical protein MRB53_014066 [Persea americana]|uniref:Uncharacterized protein n=1 Tax=Persea americana TaxID=3435 RepID=A0ACC2K9T5_PERAE|nr:hypothetical protein MRB53_014066 [Persea americana]